MLLGRKALFLRHARENLMSRHVPSHRDKGTPLPLQSTFVHGPVGPEFDDTFFCPNRHTNGSVKIAAPSLPPDQRQ
jgi:hypothetical protein